MNNKKNKGVISKGFDLDYKYFDDLIFALDQETMLLAVKQSRQNFKNIQAEQKQVASPEDRKVLLYRLKSNMLQIGIIFDENVLYNNDLEGKLKPTLEQLETYVQGKA